MVPPISDPRWKQILTKQMQVQVKSFSLQMTLNLLQTNVENKITTLDNAIKSLHENCTKYERIYVEDLKTIFK